MRKSPTRQERLKGTFALERVFGSSKKAGVPGVKLLFAENGLEYNRTVISPVRKFGGAVRRNRARRVGKEAYRAVKSSIKPGYDLAFILFPGDYTYGERINQFSSLLRRAGLYNEV
jgi:ribonuclease P protein component